MPMVGPNSGPLHTWFDMGLKDVVSATRRVGGRHGKRVFLTQKSLFFTVFRPKTTIWPSLGRISVEILMATTRSRQFF